MSELPPPGNYWLVTQSGTKRKAVVADHWTVLIHQESIWSWREWRGDKWWQPPIETVEEAGWTFVPRVTDG